MNTGSNPRPASVVIGDAECVGDTLSLTLDDSWLQGRSWYGGIQLATAFKAARRVAGGDAPIRSLHGTFLAPVSQAEPAIAEATVLRAGRSVTHMRAALRQGDRTCFDCTVVLGAARKSEVAFNSDVASDLSPESAFKLPFIPDVTPNFTQHYDLRWARGKPPFSGATDPTASIFARPVAENARYDEIEFLAITDVIPPPVISILHAPSPVSSMNCALELIRPEHVYGTRQWIRFEVTLHDAHSGYAWQTARIYGESGALLAVMHQSVEIFG